MFVDTDTLVVNNFEFCVVVDILYIAFVSSITKTEGIFYV